MELRRSRSYCAKPGDVPRKWYTVDAEGQTLGRLAVKIARALIGKTKPEYTPHVDCGDFVIVLNADKIALSGTKELYSEYQRFTGYPSGLKTITYQWMMEHHPERIIYFAVKRMMPKSKLGRKQLLKLKVYTGTEHPHAAQMPETFPW